VIELLGLGTLAGVFPVYLGIAVAFFAAKMLDRAWERFLIAVGVRT
jgi:hypothetical protein